MTRSAVYKRGVGRKTDVIESSGEVEYFLEQTKRDGGCHQARHGVVDNASTPNQGTGSKYITPSYIITVTIIT